MTVSHLLRRGRVALIDAKDDDLFRQFTWNAKRGKDHKTEYVVRTADRKRTVSLHREIGKRMGFPEKSDIDHKDGNGLNNCRDNLREATQCQNMQNRGVSAANTSGFKGVTFNRSCGKWQAMIQASGIQRYLGLFDTPESAARVYDQWAKAAHRDFAVLNFPEETK